MNLLNIFYEKNQPHLVRANSLLLVFIILRCVLIAFLPHSIQDVLNRLFTTAIFFISIYALASRSPILFLIAGILTLVQWTAKVAGISSLEILAGLLNVCFFIYVVIKLVKQFAEAKDVSAVVILGSINGYLLLGLVFSFLAAILTGFYPESYFCSHPEVYLTMKDDLHIYIYYVFVTMATVGYGDIIPTSAASQALAVLIAVTGQLYIAVLIAFLVGKFAGGHGREVKRET